MINWSGGCFGAVLSCVLDFGQLPSLRLKTNKGQGVTTYRVVITGYKAGEPRESALLRLSATFKQPVERMRTLLADSRAVVKRGVELELATKMTAAIEAAGCVCLIEPEVERSLPELEIELPSQPAAVAPSAEPARRCPYCAELVQPQAIICRHCGKALSPNAPLPTSPAATPDFSHLPEYYRDEFTKIHASGEKYKGKFNGAAFAFGGLWALTKGLWLSVLVCVAAVLIANLFGAVIYWFIYGFRGNYMYYCSEIKGKQRAL